ncbi:type III secretion system inner membrane ring lipoprotein SctJ [Arsenophonus sp. PmNCSU2021_1]|uniref:type III secretion system inner membrane ring lipoprotein SctJ n=1 Tax=Arsenophonus sp. PmNCSU2021_1 TaxID=3118989 RepID=UPI002FF1227E
MKIVLITLPLLLSILLTGCKTDLYTGLSQKEANEMYALLRNEGVSIHKEVDKENTVKLLIDESDIAQATEILKQHGYPREVFSSLKDVFPKDSLISFPVEEQARLNFVKEQALAKAISQIDGVLNAPVHVVMPNNNDKNSFSSASVFIKYAPNVQLDNYTPQIKRLIHNSIAGLDFDRISVALIPGSEILPSNTYSQEKHFLGIDINEHTYNKFIILISLLIFLLISTNLLQYFLNKRKS